MYKIYKTENMLKTRGSLIKFNPIYKFYKNTKNNKF